MPPSNELTPQARAVFTARLDEIAGEVAKDALAVRQYFNGRGLLCSSETVLKIYQCVDAAVPKMGKAAAESARLSYEAGDHRFSEALETDLLDAFEGNFASGLQRLSAMRAHETQHIQDSLSNRQMLQNNDQLSAAERARIDGQIELRRYFQGLKRARRRWYEHVPVLAKLVVWLVK